MLDSRPAEGHGALGSLILRCNVNPAVPARTVAVRNVFWTLEVPGAHITHHGFPD